MFSMLIGILSCGEDEENIAQKSVPNPGLIKPTAQELEEEPGDAWQIAWILVDKSTTEKMLTSEHIYDYDVIERQNIFAVKVLDKNGNPVPNARVEWTLLDSPQMVGDIIETDDPGFQQQAAPQLKVDNKFAFTFTNAPGDRTREMEFRCPTIISDDGTQEPTVIAVGEEGETWVVITTARKGLTDIAAYCPDIVAADEEGNKNPNPHKVFATKVWDCYDWVFPTHAVNDCEETEHTFTTRIFNYLTKVGMEGIDVRYTILNPQGSTFVDDGIQTVIPSDSNGQATVTLQAPAEAIPAVPIEVLVEILLRDDMDICDGREFVIGCAKLQKRWEVDVLELIPSESQIVCLDNADNITGDFSVMNVGTPASSDVNLIVDYPAGITVVDADGGTDDGDTVTWDIGVLASNDTVTKSPRFAAGEGGVYNFTATTASKCASAEATWTVTIIDVTASCSIAPSVIDLDPGEVFPSIPISDEPRYITLYMLTVENLGGDAVNATLGLVPPVGLKLVSGETETVTIEPGGTAEKAFALKATQAGSFSIEATVENISSVTDSAVVCMPLSTICDLEVIAGPALQVAKIDTADPVNVGNLTRYRIVIWNEGTADAYDVNIVDRIPAGMRLVTDRDFLANNPRLDPRDLYLNPLNPAEGLNPVNVVVCKVELVVVDYETGDVIKTPVRNPELAPYKWDWSFDQGNIQIHVPGPEVPEVVEGDTTLSIDVIGSEVTFNIAQMSPTWAFRISFYTQAEAVGTVVNRTDLTYREEPGGPIIPEGEPVHSDEPTTIR
jgi:uncharacterized repeat protein (TIGR01451 family)